jgi:hypothetical protein
MVMVSSLRAAAGGSLGASQGRVFSPSMGLPRWVWGLVKRRGFAGQGVLSVGLDAVRWLGPAFGPYVALREQCRGLRHPRRQAG